MPAIGTQIELQDRFTSVLYHVIDSVNLGLSAMDDLRQSMGSPVDTASIEAARDSINQATIAVQQLDAAMQGIETPEAQTPAAPQSSAPVVLPVQPDVPDPLVEQPPPVDVPIEPEQPEPVEVPVHWQTDNLEVFTGTGIERFEQEVQSANNMLNTLNNTQEKIAAAAAQADLFPAGAVSDMNTMQSRLQAILQGIQQIENAPLNMGTEAMNAELEQMRGKLDQAVREQESLNRAVGNMDVQAANEAYLRLSNTISTAERHIRDNTAEQGQFNRTVAQGTQEADGLISKIRGVAAAYATAQTGKSLLGLSDEMTQVTARLDLMNDGLQSTQDLQDMIYLSAQDARGAYQETASAVSKLGIIAGDAFGSNTEVIDFANLVNKEFAIMGTNTEGIRAAWLQLTQAMGSGVLRGEEYNSILEQAPDITDNIAGYIENHEELLAAVAGRMGMEPEELSGNVKGHLKDIAAEGILSSEIVKNAMFEASEDINAQFESMPMTFGQAWRKFANTATEAFQPVLNRMNEIVNSGTFQNLANDAVYAIAAVSDAVLEMFDLFADTGRFVADNWSAISPFIYGAAAALVIYNGYLLFHNTILAISNGLKAIAAARAAFNAGLSLAEAAATTTASGAQAGLNAALLACPVTWIVVGVISFIVVLFAVCNAIAKTTDAAESGFGIICGVVAAAAAFIWNMVIGSVNGIIQFMWNNFALPFLNLFEWVLNAANGGFDSFGGAVANLIGQIISWFLSLGMIVTKIIDTIFGTDWTAGLASLQDTVVSWGKNETAITLDRTAPELFGRIEYGDAFASGAKWGDGAADKLSGIFDGFGDLFKLDLPDEEDYLGLGSSVAGDVSGIAENVGSIKNSVSISSEELKYLRDIAGREYVNKFTTAKIDVKMTNKNNISKDVDLDGLVEGMRMRMEEEMSIAAEGVHF